METQFVSFGFTNIKHHFILICISNKTRFKKQVLGNLFDVIHILLVPFDLTIRDRENTDLVLGPIPNQYR